MDQIQPTITPSSKSKLPLILSIIAIILILLIAGALYYLNSSQLVNFEKVITNKIDTLADQVNTTEKNLETMIKEKVDTEIAKQTTKTETGYIEGSLGFPSTGIPANLTICAVETTTKKKICTSEKIKNSKYINETGYKLAVPTGTYNVYSSGKMAVNTSYGFYTKAWECNYKEAPMKSCDDHKLIPVTVTKDKTTEKVHLLDFFTEIDPANL